MLALRRGLPLALALAALALDPVLSWAVLVSPHAIFIDHRSRTGQLHLVNTGSTPEEVTIDLRFGYPDTDSAGAMYVRLIEEPDSARPSAAAWIRAYPRRVRLAPGERQVVRLLATPPAGLPDGEYWTRLIATSRGGRMPVAGADSSINVGISMEIRTIISVSYRKGAVHTGVRLDSLQAEVVGDSLVSWLAVTREGNAAYLGTAQFRLVDSAGTERAAWDAPLGLYYSLRRRFSLPLDSVPAGAYTLQLRLSTARPDLAQARVLPAVPVEATVPVTVR